MLTLYIGNKNYSSWSMRSWVLLKQAGIEFKEAKIRFDAFEGGSDFKQAISKVNPAARVPTLMDGDFAVWDTLAIAEYVAETFPDKKLWPADAHVIGKDILVPAHAIYWPIMLHALGFSDEQIPRLIVHGWWNIKGEKMSKSLGNVVDPSALADIITVDGLRYYLMRDMATGNDADLSDERIGMAYNKELAGGLGNLLNRTLKMLQNSTQGVITASTYDDEINQGLRQTVLDVPARYAEKMNAWAIHEGIAETWKIVTHANAFIDQTQPFKMKDEALADRRNSVLHHLAEALAHITVLLSPIMPEACAKIREQLNWQMPEGFTVGDLKWGLLPMGHQLNPPVPVFPRVEFGEEKK